MIRIGVVGAGNHSTHNHGPALAQCRDDAPDEVELTAVCDLDRQLGEAYAEQFGFEATYEDVARMLAEESLDAVVAVTPIHATRPVAGELLTAGIPVLVEKPPGSTVEQARELEALAERHGTPHMVSFNRRYNPAVVRAVDWLADADEPPTHAVSRLLRTERYEDGFVKNTGIHAADTVCSFLGRPTSVTTRRWSSGEAPERGSRCAARATFPDASAQLAVVSDAGSHAETYELFGPGYTARVDAAATRFCASRDGETAATWQAPEDTPGYVRNGTLGETRAFLDAVRRGEGFTPTLSDARRSYDLAAAMEAGADRAVE